MPIVWADCISGRAGLGVAEEQQLGRRQSEADLRRPRRMIDAGEDGHALGPDRRLEPVHRVLWAETARQRDQSLGSHLAMLPGSGASPVPTLREAERRSNPGYRAPVDCFAFGAQ